MRTLLLKVVKATVCSFLWLIVSSLHGTEPDRTTHEPSQALEGLISADGLECSLFAAEPMVINPAAIDVDHLGRVWACEIVNYRKRLGTRPEGDRIVILEDTNGDGKADISKVFYQGSDIDSPHGICLLATPDRRGSRAIVSTGSRVVLLIDDDGDDRCDRQEDLFTGIQGIQHDHGIHAFLFGPDGRLYFNFGNEAKQICDANGEPIRDLAGNIVNNSRQPYQEGMSFRCNLDGSNLETLAWNFRNNWMLTVDSFGNIWQSDNDDDGNRGCRINFLMEYGNYGFRDELTGASWQTPRTGQEVDLPGKHWHVNDPGVVPSMLYIGNGSPAGITMYEGNLLPSAFHGRLMHCDPGHNVVRSYQIQEEGAGYTAEMTDILTGVQDPWFRPVDVKVAPDGSVFVADWCDPGVGGHDVGDLQQGRIFRITPSGESNHYTVPQYNFSTPSDAAAALGNPNFAVRAIAWQQFLSWGSSGEPELAKLWELDDLLLRARALWLLGAIAKDSSNYIVSALSSEDPRLRILGLRLARQQKWDMVPVVKRMQDDPSPQIQRELAISLANNQSLEAAQAWAQLAANYKGNDRWLLEALGTGARGNWDACLAAWLSVVGEEWKGVAGSDIVWRSRATVTPKLLAELVLQATERGADADRYLRAFDFQAEPGRSAGLAQLLDQDYSLPPRVVVEILNRLPDFDVTSSSESKHAVNDFLKSQPGGKLYHQLIRRFHLKEHMADLLDQLTGPNNQTSVDAAWTILTLEGVESLLQVIRTLDDARADTLVTVGQLNNPEINQLLRDMLLDDSVGQPLRVASARGLTKSSTGQHLLIEITQNGQLPKHCEFLVADALHASPDPVIRRQGELLLSLPHSADAVSLPPLKQLLDEVGNIENGRKVFAQVGTCADCHRIQGGGKQVGPDLSEIGAKLSREAMYHSILDPSAGISHNYEQYIVVLDSGQSSNGLLVSETDESIILRNAEGIDSTYLQDEIEDYHKSDISLMPAGLQLKLTKQQLVDLVEYLLTLKKAS